MRPTPLLCATHFPTAAQSSLYCPLHEYRGAGFDPVPCPPLDSPDYFLWVVL